MIDDIFVFDCVIHVYDLSDANTLGSLEARAGRDSMLAIGGALRWPGYHGEGQRFDKRWSIEEIYEMVFVAAPTDMAMAQVVPIFDWFEDFFAPVAAQHAMAERYPERVLFCGGADPVYRGLADALEQIDHQVRELGVKVLQFHKGLPFGLQPLGPLSPLDLERPARDFPDMTFVIHHLAEPFFDEAVSLGSRYPNVYLALSGNLNLAPIAPRLVQERLGRLLMEVGVHKLLWGSEAALAGGPAPYLRAFMELEIPEDLRRGYGYPQVTREDKELILGRNFARLMGIDLDAKRAELGAHAA